MLIALVSRAGLRMRTGIEVRTEVGDAVRVSSCSLIEARLILREGSTDENTVSIECEQNSSRTE